jgi:hypothetical protein
MVGLPANIVAGNSVDQPAGNFDAPRNVFLSVTPVNNPSNENTNLTWLTNYNANSQIYTSTPHLVKIDVNRFIVLWTEGETVKYVTVDGQGRKLTDVISVNGALSDCKPIFANGSVRWYVTGNSQPVFYSIKIDEGNNTAPAVIPGQENQSGTAAPASNDGKVAAVTYQADASQWFTDADGDTLTYTSTGGGGGTLELNAQTGALSYTPAVSDAEQLLNFNVWANDGELDSEKVMLSIRVDKLPGEVDTNEITFFVSNGSGTLTATVDGSPVVSPAEVQDGKDVMFTATPDAGYRVKEWRIETQNDVYVPSHNSDSFTYFSVSLDTTVTVEFEPIPVAKDGFIEEEGGWYYYINNERAAPGFYEVDGYWRAIESDGRLYDQGFHEIGGYWRYILNGAIVSPPGIYQTDIYYRLILDGGIMAVAGFHEVDSIWRYVLNGAIVAPVGWYENLDGYLRYVADGGLLLPQGWHEIDGVWRYILNGSIPASGWMEVDGILFLFNELGVPIDRQ